MKRNNNTKKNKKQQCSVSVSDPLLRDTSTSDSKGNYGGRSEGKGTVGYFFKAAAAAVNFLPKSSPLSCQCLPLPPSSHTVSITVACTNGKWRDETRGTLH